MCVLVSNVLAFVPENGELNPSLPPRRKRGIIITLSLSSTIIDHRAVVRGRKTLRDVIPIKPLISMTDLPDHQDGEPVAPNSSHAILQAYVHGLAGGLPLTRPHSDKPAAEAEARR